MMSGSVVCESAVTAADCCSEAAAAASTVETTNSQWSRAKASQGFSSVLSPQYFSLTSPHLTSPHLRQLLKVRQTDRDGRVRNVTELAGYHINKVFLRRVAVGGSHQATHPGETPLDQLTRAGPDFARLRQTSWLRSGEIRGSAVLSSLTSYVAVNLMKLLTRTDCQY